MTVLAEIKGNVVIARFGNMRNYQTFTVYPGKPSDRHVIAQSSRSIVRIDLSTGKGMWNPKGCYFPHLSPVMGAKEVELPESFVENCRKLAGVQRPEKESGHAGNRDA